MKKIFIFTFALLMSCGEGWSGKEKPHETSTPLHPTLFPRVLHFGDDLADFKRKMALKTNQALLRPPQRLKPRDKWCAFYANNPQDPDHAPTLYAQHIYAEDGPGITFTDAYYVFYDGEGTFFPLKGMAIYNKQSGWEIFEGALIFKTDKEVKDEVKWGTAKKQNMRGDPQSTWNNPFVLLKKGVKPLTLKQENTFIKQLQEAKPGFWSLRSLHKKMGGLVGKRAGRADTATIQQIIKKFNETVGQAGVETPFLQWLSLGSKSRKLQTPEIKRQKPATVPPARRVVKEGKPRGRPRKNPILPETDTSNQNTPPAKARSKRPINFTDAVKNLDGLDLENTRWCTKILNFDSHMQRLRRKLEKRAQKTHTELTVPAPLPERKPGRPRKRLLSEEPPATQARADDFTYALASASPKTPSSSPLIPLKRFKTYR